MQKYKIDVRPSPGYENIIRQLALGDGYDKFLCELMKIEITQKQEAGQRRRI